NISYSHSSPPVSARGAGRAHRLSSGGGSCCRCPLMLGARAHTAITDDRHDLASPSQSCTTQLRCLPVWPSGERALSARPNPPCVVGGVRAARANPAHGRHRWTAGPPAILTPRCGGRTRRGDAVTTL